MVFGNDDLFEDKEAVVGFLKRQEGEGGGGGSDKMWHFSIQTTLRR